MPEQGTTESSRGEPKQKRNGRWYIHCAGCLGNMEFRVSDEKGQQPWDVLFNSGWHHRLDTLARRYRWYCPECEAKVNGWAQASTGCGRRAYEAYEAFDRAAQERWS